MNVVWPRAVIRGSTAVMWVDVPAAGNVTIRLTAEQRVYEDKTIPILQPGWMNMSSSPFVLFCFVWMIL